MASVIRYVDRSDDEYDDDDDDEDNAPASPPAGEPPEPEYAYRAPMRVRAALERAAPTTPAGRDAYMTIEGARRAQKRDRAVLERAHVPDAQLERHVRVERDFVPAYRSGVRGATVTRIQGQRAVRARTPTLSSRQYEYQTDEFCVRLQAALADDIRRRGAACLSDAIAYNGASGYGEATDISITKPMTATEAIEDAADFEPPALVVDPPGALLGERRRANRALVYADSVLDPAWRAANGCSSLHHRIVVRVGLPGHAVLMLWLPDERRLELFDSGGFCASDDEALRTLELLDGWMDTLFIVVEHQLGIAQLAHDRAPVCAPLQWREGHDTGGGYCQTWVWFWAYHRLVRGCSVDAILARLRPRDEPRRGQTALDAIERFKAEASADRAIITQRYC